MLHARNDYQGIQDPDGHTSIKHDEPVFLLRAKDVLAPATLRFWATKLREVGGDLATADHILAFADRMVQWQIDNNLQDYPDTPEEHMIKL